METAEEEKNPETLPIQGADRPDYLQLHNPSIMYLWYVLLSKKMFQVSSQEFSLSFGMDNGDVPDITSNLGTNSSVSTGRTNMTAVVIKKGSKRQFQDVAATLDNLVVTQKDMVDAQNKLNKSFDQFVELQATNQKWSMVVEEYRDLSAMLRKEKQFEEASAIRGKSRKQQKDKN